jgi:hypothetical protein
MMQILKFFLFQVVFICLPSQVYGQQKSNHFLRHNLHFSVEVLFTRDYTNRMPIVGQDAWAVYFVQRALNLNLRLKSFGNFHLETGYRYKGHWHTFEYDNLISSSGSLIANSHSIPLRMSWEKKTKHKRWGFSICGGVMGTYLTNAYSKGYLLSGVTLPSGTYIGEVFFEEKDRSRPYFIPLLDGALRVDFRVYKNIYLTLGYGGAKSFHNLSEGRYTVKGPSSSLLSSGTISQVGSYDYWILGVNFPLVFDKYGSKE